MKLLDLFSGIGGFSLAAHWMGWETVGFVEIDPFCQKVLKKNFPNVPIYGDIKQFDGKKYNGSIDLICGGFPCQPFSTAGKRKGKNDDRFLWHEMLRVIKEVKPTWIVGENVAGLLSMGNGSILDDILTDLENEGYQTETFIIPACAVQAPHRRDRIWIVAHAEGINNRRSAGKFQEPDEQRRKERSKERVSEFGSTNIELTSNTSERRWRQTHINNNLQCGQSDLDRYDCSALTHAGHSTNRGVSRKLSGKDGQIGIQEREQIQYACQSNSYAADSNSEQKHTTDAGRFHAQFSLPDWGSHWYEVATKLCGTHDGISAKLDRNRAKRLKALGNSIVPQLAYEIFKAIELFIC